jgi:hypothetical protein
LCWGYIVAFIKVLISNISYLNSSPPSFSLIPLSPIPGIVSTGLIFPFTCMYTQHLYYIHPPCLLLYLIPLNTGTNSSDRACSALLFSDFVKGKKKKKDIFVGLR